MMTRSRADSWCLKGATLLGALLLLVSAARGWFSWDYFSLWGLHPKWVWATGDFFTPGTELPIAFRYQSLFGSLQGWLLRLFDVGTYPDTLWGYLNVSLALIAGAWIIYRQGGFRSDVHRLMFVLGLLFILPPEWGQITFGGYADLVGSLGITAAVLGALSDDIVLFAAGTAFTFASRPVNAHWLIWVILSLALSKKSSRKFLLQATASLALAWLAQKGVYRLARYQTLPAVPLTFTPNSLTLKERLWLPVKILLSNNGLAGLAILSSWSLIKRQRFWAWFMGFGVLIMFWAYTFVFPRTAAVYPSIGRYTLPLSLPWLFALATRTDVAWNFTERINPRVLLALFTLVALGRGAEDIQILKRDGGWSTKTNYCYTFETACAEGRRLHQIALTRSGCDVFVLPHAPSSLDHLVKIYAALPTRLYFADSQIPRHLRACPIDSPGS